MPEAPMYYTELYFCHTGILEKTNGWLDILMAG